jgi:hypothetical protein
MPITSRPGGYLYHLKLWTEQIQALNKAREKKDCVCGWGKMWELKCNAEKHFKDIKTTG